MRPVFKVLTRNDLYPSKMSSERLNSENWTVKLLGNLVTYYLFHGISYNSTGIPWPSNDYLTTLHDILYTNMRFMT